MNQLLMALQSKNPMSVLNHLAQQNPQIAGIMQMVTQLNNAAPTQQEQFIKQFCQQNGIDFNGALQQYQHFLQGGLQQNGQWIRTNNQ